jgi:hypothetical protein
VALAELQRRGLRRIRAAGPSRTIQRKKRQKKVAPVAMPTRIQILIAAAYT